ncbi:MAG TPA: hypothetical protein VMZ52_10880 [Bryobacteraceae bacterium]|nr:hypothetical protein [Bryobacteraceae bacterium]
MTRRQFIATASAASLAGAQNEKKYLSAARTFLDTMIEKGSDRYGPKSTPLFCLSLDPETYAPPLPPPAIDREYRLTAEHLYRDYGYYWKSHLHGSNLIYDQGTIRALYFLSDTAGDRKYSKAADNCLHFFLNNLVSESTGIFGWGEHLFYNVFLDYLSGGSFTVRAGRKSFYAHEFDRWTTIYDVFWEQSPEKTRTEIEAIYEYKIHDKETFLNNRHSDFHAGQQTSDALTFLKHSGLFTHAFAFLYSKTTEPKHLEWARKAADLFWGYRDPRTNLVRNCVQRKEEAASAEGMAEASLFLLRAYQWQPDAKFLERALAYVHAYQKYFALGNGRFRDTLSPDGTDRQPGQLAEYWEAPIRQAKAATLAYSLTGDPIALELADNVITHLTPAMSFKDGIERSRISAEVEARSCSLGAALDLYEATADIKYLAKARELADDAIKRFLYRGLFVSTLQLQPEGDRSATTRVYDGRSGAGWLALNLLRLQRDQDRTQAGQFRKFAALERTFD